MISFDDFQSLLHIENKQKLTPIHIAVGNCNFEVAHLDIAQECHKRCNRISVCHSTNKQGPSLMCLLAYDKNAKFSGDTSDPRVDLLKARTSKGHSVFHTAAAIRHGGEQVIKVLVKNLGFHIDDDRNHLRLTPNTHGFMPIHLAADANNTAAMKCLKLLNEVTNEGDNIMHCCKSTNSYSNIESCHLNSG